MFKLDIFQLEIIN